MATSHEFKASLRGEGGGWQNKSLHVRSGVRTTTEMAAPERGHRRRKSVSLGSMMKDREREAGGKAGRSRSKGPAPPRNQARRGSVVSPATAADLHALFTTGRGSSDDDPPSVSLGGDEDERKEPRRKAFGRRGRRASMSDLHASLPVRMGRDDMEVIASEASRDAKTMTRVRYYKNKLPVDGQVVVRVINEEKGKGMFAAKDIPEGSTIFVESKLVGMQTYESRQTCLTCTRCMKFVGPLEGHLERLGRAGIGSATAASTPVPTLPFKNRLIKNLEVKPVYCKGKCGAVYCSLRCRVEDRLLHHQLLCSGDKVFGRDLEDFYQHADETNEAFRMVAQCIALVIRRMQAKGMSLGQALRPLDYFKKELWWRVVQPPEELTYDEAEAFTQTLRDMAATSLEFLRSALCRHKELEPLFELDFYGQLVGMLETNNWGTSSKNPLSLYWSHLKTLSSAQKRQAKRELGPWYDVLKAGHNHHASGTGLYIVGATINHSCVPNVCLTKKREHDDDTSAIVSTRPIQAGEEICLSYIDEQMPFKERQAALAEFQFECRCVKCLRDIIHQKPVVEIYTSEVSGSTQTRKDTRALKYLFDAHGIEYSIVDISLDENVHEKEMMHRKTGGNREIPQVFVNGAHRGGWKVFETANEQERLSRFVKFGDLRKTRLLL